MMYSSPICDAEPVPGFQLVEAPPNLVATARDSRQLGVLVERYGVGDFR